MGLEEQFQLWKGRTWCKQAQNPRCPYEDHVAGRTVSRLCRIRSHGYPGILCQHWSDGPCHGRYPGEISYKHLFPKATRRAGDICTHAAWPGCDSDPSSAVGNIQGGEGKVQASILESYARNPRPKKLNDALRLEYRSKLLNPKWANTMVEQGSGGAFEVSQRMTALVGWGATTKFTEDWVYEQSAETYALDPEMAKKLMDANPEAFKNIVGRLIEANNRGMWDAKEDTIEALRDMYEDIDNEIELGSVSAKRLAEITIAQRKK
jgi:hypothetical protein